VARRPSYQPWVDEPPAITTTTHNGPPRRGIPPRRLRVLVADDNRDAADILGGLLSLAGADVRVCYDGTTAAAALAEFRPDAGVFDLQMPGMDECELARVARGLAGIRPQRLVAVSGLGDDEAVRRTATAGFDAHMTKPADPRALIATLSDFDQSFRAKPR
jgi:CheY-like chemotaxis protein